MEWELLEEAFDDVTGEALDPKEVKKARTEEVEFLNTRGIWEPRPENECFEKTGKHPTSEKWVDVQKGEAVRSRGPRFPNERCGCRYVERVLRVHAATRGKEDLDLESCVSAGVRERQECCSWTSRKHILTDRVKMSMLTSHSPRKLACLGFVPN